MERAQATLLADGRRLHLHHGPIDLIIEVFGSGRNEAYGVAKQRFETVLDELVIELPLLRTRARFGARFSGAIARRMQEAVELYCPEFVTPMAAVAGAVADEILQQMQQVPNIDKAYVNNGGDVAFYLAKGEQISAAMAALPEGRITLDSSAQYRGVATSGWQGRSFSLGIADSVSVVAQNAAAADVAATLIANAVNIADHPNVKRLPAMELSPDSDLGDLEVTTSVGHLTRDEITHALDRGEYMARSCADQNLIGGAILHLKDSYRQVGTLAIQQTQSNINPERKLTDA